MSQEWSATVRVSFGEDTTPIQHAETVAVLSGAWAEFLGKIEVHEAQVTMGLSNGRNSTEPRAPAGTNGGPTNGRRKRGPNKPKIQTPAWPLAHGAIPTESDE